ncbi:alpha/beta fold hydrolase [Rhodococcus xishaensis]|uniref:Alpha/beta hydrolase n=1 Tax=Rhodococcus xishaensis TaxID=2487364 RepID=A0A438AYQ8_9NOCA|nr:alpha/beta hydrolase [Rhodococcus xishaensis]RVW03789.1 alpha/beta hydrolase [Rhodococcus xishaensis]
MPQVALPQAAIKYQVLGPKDSLHPPVLFIHGLCVDYRLWTETAEALARSGFRCVMPTLPLGAHTIPVDDTVTLSFAGLATLIRDLMDALDLKDVTLVGSDTGGGLCQVVIDYYPDHVGRLVLANCDAFEKFPPFPFTLSLELMRGPISIKTLFTLMRLVLPFRHSPLGYDLLTDEYADLTEAWFEPCRNDPRICRDLAILARQISVSDLVGVSTRLHKFTKPVVLVWGQRDRLFTPRLGRRLEAVFPNSTLIEVPNARTFVPLDDPEAVIDAITSVGASAPLDVAAGSVR